jgi:hypothetical protein
VGEPHALLIEKHLEIQDGITLCIHKSQLEIQVVTKNLEEIFWTLFSNKDWENFGIYCIVNSNNFLFYITIIFLKGRGGWGGPCYV